MKSVSEVVGILIKGSKECLNIGSAWGREWNIAPACILFSIQVINGIFIAYKEKKLKILPSTQNVGKLRIFEFIRVAHYVTDRIFLILPIAITIRGIFTFVIQGSSHKKNNIVDIAGCVAVSALSGFASIQYRNYLKNKLSKIEKEYRKRLRYFNKYESVKTDGSNDKIDAISDCEALGTLIDWSKQCLNIGGAWKRVWNTAPAYILSSIPVVNGIFIAYKAKQVKSIAASKINVRHVKTHVFANIAESVTKYSFLTTFFFVIVQSCREIIFALEMKETPWRWSKNQFFLQQIRLCVGLFAIFGVPIYSSFIENKLAEICNDRFPSHAVSASVAAEIYNNYCKLESLSTLIHAAKSRAEAKAIVSFFEDNYGSVKQIDFFSDSYGSPEIIHIFETDNIEVVKYLVEEQGADQIPLHYAIDNLETVKYLVEKGAADVNGTIFTAHRGCITPLYMVNNLKVAQYLIRKGADLYARSRHGHTPLTACAFSIMLHAACRGDPQAELPRDAAELVNRMKILLACGADRDHKNGKGHSLYEMFGWIKNPNFRLRFQKFYDKSYLKT